MIEQTAEQVVEVRGFQLAHSILGDILTLLHYHWNTGYCDLFPGYTHLI